MSFKIGDWVTVKNPGKLYHNVSPDQEFEIYILGVSSTGIPRAGIVTLPILGLPAGVYYFPLDKLELVPPKQSQHQGIIDAIANKVQQTPNKCSCHMRDLMMLGCKCDGV